MIVERAVKACRATAEQAEQLRFVAAVAAVNCSPPPMLSFGMHPDILQSAPTATPPP